MQKNMRLIAMLLCVLMLVSYLPFQHAHAAEKETNLVYELSKTEVNIGDEVTLKIGIKEMRSSSTLFGVFFDTSLLEVTKRSAKQLIWSGYDENEEEDVEDASLLHNTLTGTKAANKSGYLGIVFVNVNTDVTYSAMPDVLTITFTAKAAGSATFTFREDSDGEDTYKSDNAATTSLTIKANEPVHECTPGAVSYEKGTNGKHTVIVACADTTCDKIYSTTEEDCSDKTGDRDHSCDGCGQPGITECADGDNDHNCDECGKELSDCSDKTGDQNHNCDVCGKPGITECADGNSDHNCDECGKELSDCSDKTGDQNHNCDVCGKPGITECSDGNSDHNCDECGKELSDCSDKTGDQNHNCDVCGKPGITECADGNSDHNCDECGKELSDCSDKTGDQNHNCDVCGKPGITECSDGNSDHNCDECGKELSKCSDKTGDRDHNCDVCGEPDITECSGGDATCLNKAVCSECGKEYGEKDSKNHVGKQTINYTDNGKDHTVTVTCECGSEISSKVVAHEYGEGFECVCEHKLAGWQQKGDAWYYVVDGKPVTGATRVPYPTIAINGVTYAANEEDKAFAQANAESKYSDAETAVFVFDKDGKFLQTTGIVDGNRYAVNGMIAWHVGLVKVDNNYYYFLGDVNGGGNIMATGKVYASRNTTDLNITKGGIYTFGDDGKMDLYDGIVNIDGTLYYYEENRLAIEAGLVEVDGGYYYVRSSGDRSGQLVVGRDYWVATTNGLLSAGMYTFADDGKIIMVEENEEYDGIVEIDNKLYYYVDGVRQVGAGVVQMTDEQGETFYIYVCSDGKLATGIYWPTIRNDLLEQGAYNWGTNGRYYPTKG